MTFPLPNVSNDLSGRVALVTGASSGLGVRFAKTLAACGAKVGLAARRTDRLEAVAEEIRAAGGEAICISMDATDADQLFAAVDALEKAYGTVDILINNAGITRDTLMLRMTENQWDEVIETNLKSAFNLTKAFLKHFLGNRAGSIINMSSVVGVTGNAGQANYAASKAGLIGFTKSIAKELGSRNIRCNAIAPGFIETEMTETLDENVKKGWMETIPLKRGGTPEDVANACVFLASDMSTYITGQTLSVCGGMLM